MADLPLEHVHVEPQQSSDGPAPAVFVLHGRGADEEDLLPVARQLPDTLHVVSLRAPDRLMGGYTWYELDMSAGGLHQSQPHAEEFRRSLDLVSESIDAAVEAYDLDADNLGLLGFSQGSITSLALLLENPDRFAWVVALHGYLAESHTDLEPSELTGKPVFVGAGSADQIIPAARAEAAADRLQELGADVSFSVYEVGHGVGQDELHDLVSFVETRLS
ncbi:phospholipase [Haloprofundus marisrubri]|uniref:Phospholipase n=1 Tax=Haloprofundus marisrubri TaxID=1514971 RepID=A0A0W1RD07_9EURY|nr:dienelactone hydrolase family protein [Haloprofundus marisrubri]KTG11295.1 phospholipase [Haloprofundus marisrubri]